MLAVFASWSLGAPHTARHTTRYHLCGCVWYYKHGTKLLSYSWICQLHREEQHGPTLERSFSWRIVQNNLVMVDLHDKCYFFPLKNKLPPHKFENQLLYILHVFSTFVIFQNERGAFLRSPHLSLYSSRGLSQVSLCLCLSLICFFTGARVKKLGPTRPIGETRCGRQ
jgi:hypothetical protein